MLAPRRRRGRGAGDEQRRRAGRRDRPRADRFDSARAWEHLRHQVALGPRPAGSPQLAELAGYLRARLPRGRFEAVPGHPGLRNVVGRIPGGKPGDRARRALRHEGPAGLRRRQRRRGRHRRGARARARAAQAKRPKGAPEIRFVLFDGEEATDDSRPFEATGLRGSKAYAARHAEEIRALVLLDFVAEKGAMRIPREGPRTPGCGAACARAAKRVGSAASAFPPGVAGEVTDDHTPFVRAGSRRST